MKFNIIVKKWAIFYFFVQNLSEWHFSCIKEYNEEWLKELGSLTKNQIMLLEKFREIHLKYSFGNNFLGSHFYLRKKPIKSLKKSTTLQEAKIIRRVFSSMEKKFNLLYVKELPLLREWQNILEKKLKNHQKTKLIIKSLNKIYNVNNPKKGFNIFLLPSKKDITAGWGYIGDDKSMAIAISSQSLKNCNHTIAVIWHEAIHRFFEKEYFLPIVKGLFPDDQDAINLIKEVTVSSLFPNGLFGKKFLGIKAKSLNRKLPNKYNESILGTINHYIKNGQHLDEKYIKKIYSITKKLKGELR